jgi:hypothetical protein
MGAVSGLVSSAGNHSFLNCGADMVRRSNANVTIFGAKSKSLEVGDLLTLTNGQLDYLMIYSTQSVNLQAELIVTVDGVDYAQNLTTTSFYRDYFLCPLEGYNTPPVFFTTLNINLASITAGAGYMYYRYRIN